MGECWVLLSSDISLVDRDMCLERYDAVNCIGAGLNALHSVYNKTKYYVIIKLYLMISKSNALYNISMSAHIPLDGI